MICLSFSTTMNTTIILNGIAIAKLRIKATTIPEMEKKLKLRPKAKKLIQQNHLVLGTKMFVNICFLFGIPEVTNVGLEMNTKTMLKMNLKSSC